jgi:prepilin signal peptidase PulO-like enzyme (type II secretory pathway)
MTPQHVVWCRLIATNLWITQHELPDFLMNADVFAPFLPTAWPILVFFGIFGAVIGSFLTLITYRLPLDEKIGRTRSRCTSCGVVLKVLDLIPVLSWLMGGGKCRHCKARISVRYVLTELACAFGAVAIIYHYGVTLEAFAILGLWWAIVAIIVTDLEHYIILDEVQITIGLLGIVHGYVQQYTATDVAMAAFAGAAIGLGLKYGFLYLRHKDALGMGDVKFLFVAGIWLECAENFVPFLFFSGVLGTVCGLVWRAVGLGDRFPFGPALALSLFMCVVTPSVATDFWQLYGLLQ